MPDLLVRGIRDDAKAELAARAARAGRSLQAEARLILEGAALPQEAAPSWGRTETALNTPDSAALRTRKRVRIFEELDSINAIVDTSKFPDVADMIASMRDQQDQDDERWLPTVAEGDKA